MLAARSYSAKTVTTYAVKWREPDGQTFVGRLALGARTFRLVGRTPGADGPTVDRQIGYDELQASARSEAAASTASTAGRRSSSSEPMVRTSSPMRGWAPRSSRSSSNGSLIFVLRAPRKATVVVPLKEGAIDHVRDLVCEGSAVRSGRDAPDAA